MACRPHGAVEMRGTILIAGAGAAGCMAALTLLENGCPADKIILIDGNEKIAKKIYATGNGRCNLANARMEEDCYYSGSGDPMRFVNGFRPSVFFEEHGIPVHERSGYFYPRTDQAATVARFFEKKILRSGLLFLPETFLEKVQKTGSGFTCTLRGADGKKSAVSAEGLILATGGLVSRAFHCTGTGLSVAEKLGHTIVPVHPALTSLTVSDPLIKAAAGVRTTGSITADGRTEEGELQFTKTGISGIPVFQVSRLVSGKLLEGEKEVSVTLDLVPDIGRNDLEKIRVRRREELSSLTAGEILFGLIPEGLSSYLVRRVGLADEKKMKNVGNPDAVLDHLFSLLKDLPFMVTGTGSYETSQVTAGGVALSEVDPDTMESKVCPGLYPVGELLDADGICGGYNLTFAFATGYRAGLSLAKL